MIVAHGDQQGLFLTRTKLTRLQFA